MIAKVEPKVPPRWICHVCAKEPRGLTWKFETCSVCKSSARVCTEMNNLGPITGLDQQPKIL